MGRRTPGIVPLAEESQSPPEENPTLPMTPPDPIVALSPILGKGNWLRLSQKTGLSRKHVSYVLQGKSPFSFEIAQRIADAAGIGLDELREYIDIVKVENKNNGANDNSVTPS
jgi:transcriptional regulator with XRE-family HTH domain